MLPTNVEQSKSWSKHNEISPPRTFVWLKWFICTNSNDYILVAIPCIFLSFDLLCIKKTVVTHVPFNQELYYSFKICLTEFCLSMILAKKLYKGSRWNICVKTWRQKSFVIKPNLSTLIEIQIIKFSCFAQ